MADKTMKIFRNTGRVKIWSARKKGSPDVWEKMLVEQVANPFSMMEAENGYEK